MFVVFSCCTQVISLLAVLHFLLSAHVLHPQAYRRSSGLPAHRSEKKSDSIPCLFNVQEKAVFSHCCGKSGADSLKSPSCGFLASIKPWERALWTGDSLNGQHKVEESRRHLWSRRRGMAAWGDCHRCWRDDCPFPWPGG